MKITLLSPYEIGRQPFGLAQPAAWLTEAGFEVRCLDLSVQSLEPEALEGAGLVGVYVAMHTATRIAVEALPKVKTLAPGAVLCSFGLYSPMNAALLKSHGVAHVLGGESEPDLLDLANRLRAGEQPKTNGAQVNLSRIQFRVPDRTALPPLESYAGLLMPDGSERRVGFAEGTRGCKHLCRHCPVVPVYQGRFTAIPVDVVIEDIANQVASGAEHISFGDPDFLNGPTHALRIARAMHERFPGLSFDATVKIEHLLKHADRLAELRACGCLFVISAVESVDDAVLAHLDKGHHGRDLDRVVALLRDTGIALSPTFVPFTPWTTRAGYAELLQRLVALELVECVAPIQLAIRLLVPAGSRLLELSDFRRRVGDFDPDLLGHPWRHDDAGVDTLQRQVMSAVERSEANDVTRRETFETIWTLAHESIGTPPPSLPTNLGRQVPHLSEPWYCCAEPTSQQLNSF